MSEVQLYNEACERAMRAKAAYAASIKALAAAAEEYGQPIRDAYTRKLRADKPDLVARIEVAYKCAGKITDEMMEAGRWPKERERLPKYLDTLEAIPDRQRSPEMIECLAYWKVFDACQSEIEALYPAPKNFYWNGAQLCGPVVRQLDMEMAST